MKNVSRSREIYYGEEEVKMFLEFSFTAMKVGTKIIVRPTLILFLGHTIYKFQVFGNPAVLAENSLNKGLNLGLK